MANNLWDAPLEEEQGFRLAKEGTYDFEVIEVTGKNYTPKPGSKMPPCAEIDVTLRVETPEGDVRVWDRLYSANRRMTEFAKCIEVFQPGMTPGQLLRACNGCIGKAKIGIEPATAQYKAKNRVVEYLAPVKEAKKEARSDDLPF